MNQLNLGGAEMKDKKKMVVGLFCAVVIASAIGSGTTYHAESKTFDYKETEAATYQRGLDNQPESSYWFPEELLEWEFSKDPDAPYNVSKVPLAKRIDKKALTTSNDTQTPEMKVVALSIMNSSTSGNAPRGINTFDANVFSNWQYIDQLVYWGGSSGEGIIVPPSPDVIDAAHKNGVPVLGTVFFPQSAHGGKIEWLDTFLQKDEDGTFPLVDQLIEVATLYGFDGWFINQETDTVVTSFDDANAQKKVEGANAAEGLSKEHADLMQEFIKQFKQKAATLDIMWYDSMTSEGKMDWQNALTDKNQVFLVDAEMNPLADSMFLNFWWNTDRLASQELLKASKKKANELGIDPYQLYAGIDVQQNGYDTPVNWRLFTDETGTPYTSLGLYVPSWTYTSASDPADFQRREMRFWVNEQGDPTKGKAPVEKEWPGISTYAVEQSAITSVPFVTNFSMGNGYGYFINGKKVSDLAWNNRSMQNVLPTYRWIFEHQGENQLAVEMDYDEAFRGGNSLLLKGSMENEATSTIKLYRMDGIISDKTSITTTAKATSISQLDLVLEMADGRKEIISASEPIGRDWTTVSYDVSQLAGEKINTLSYQLASSETQSDYALHLGQLALTDGKEPQTTKVSGLMLEDVAFDEEEGRYAGIRLAWDETESQASYYEIYRVNPDNSTSFLGATPATNHYINALERNLDTTQTKLIVVPVDVLGNQGEPSEVVSFDWPDNKVPRADFTASRTLAAPGSAITFRNTSSLNTETVTWEFEGGDITTSHENSPVVTYDKEGVYKVKLTASNQAGETPVEKIGLITISNKVPTELPLLSRNAKATASSYTNEAEAPHFAIDGDLTTKWCATGTPPHELTLDLGHVQTISEVRIDHAQAGGESPDMNTKTYAIEISTDGEVYTEVAKTTNNTTSHSLETFAVRSARYVRLRIEKPTQGSDTAARIYGFEVFGLPELLH